MAKLINIEPSKTYATRENAIKAVDKKLDHDYYSDIHYVIMPHSDGRFFPLFIGNKAIEAGIHFHFNVVN